jgi:hypothetical protein
MISRCRRNSAPGRKIRIKGSRDGEESEVGGLKWLRGDSQLCFGVRKGRHNGSKGKGFLGPLLEGASKNKKF